MFGLGVRFTGFEVVEYYRVSFVGEKVEVSYALYYRGNEVFVMSAKLSLANFIPPRAKDSFLFS